MLFIGKRRGGEPKIIVFPLLEGNSDPSLSVPSHGTDGLGWAGMVPLSCSVDKVYSWTLTALLCATCTFIHNVLSFLCYLFLMFPSGLFLVPRSTDVPVSLDHTFFVSLRWKSDVGGIIVPARFLSAKVDNLYGGHGLQGDNQPHDEQ